MRTRPIARPIATEDQEHIALMRWASYHPILRDHLIHIPNGGSRHVLEARKLKRMGVKPGVSDLFLAYAAKDKHGLWLELKRVKGSSTSDSQKDWLALMERAGYAAVIAFGCEDAKEKIEHYLS